MGLEAFFPSVGDKIFLTKALLSTSVHYVNIRQFTVRRVATVHVTFQSPMNRDKMLESALAFG